METRTVYWGYMETMEKTMEKLLECNRVYIGVIRVILG